MTTAFLAEVDTPNGTRYIGKNGKLQKLPIFYSVSQRLKNIFASKQRSHYPITNFDWYLSHRDAHLTRVVIVDNVEKGLKASTGSNINVAEFIVKEFSNAGKYAPKKPVNAIFKIEIDVPKFSGKKIVIKYAGGGKFGRTWERQGDLRLHINSNIHRLHGYYKGADVIMIEIDPADGITPLEITKMPIIDWFCQSRTSNIRYNDLMRTSIVNAPDKASRSPYA